MSLSGVIGQHRAVGILTGMIRRGRVATSFLFAGETGVGKMTTALNFIKTLNCTNRVTPDGEPEACDRCDACVRADSGTHPDFHVIQPHERQIRIEEIRIIEEALSLRPYEGGVKSVIVDGADAMTVSAANAFLKTLEEPPENSLIILISDKPDRLPDTIRSRCTRINFQNLSFEDCLKVIAGKTTDDDVESAVLHSMGRPGLVIRLDFREEVEWFRNLFNGMLRAEKDGWSSRDDMERWFEICLSMLRDLAVVKVHGTRAHVVNAELSDAVNRWSTNVDLQVIISLYYDLRRVQSLLRFNLNKSLTWNYTASLFRKEFFRTDG